eukprot:TRINITY_DN53_c0_g1_i1.p1 TRINITY_DN53_c0_g1~~TRINITY_DN53_c0_g1_i1.p1  ORF type:complete len:192 (+),score=52.38 TRINITY_DN53_c0_g1_i1:48-578(+)
MLIQTKNRDAIMTYLFHEGVIVAENKVMKRHPALPVTNLEVIQLMRGFTSKELVKKQYAWRHYYWTLTPKGINHLREVLHLPADIVPTTWKKTARSVAERDGGRREWRGEGGRGGGGGERRSGYGRGAGGGSGCYSCGESGHIARNCPGKAEGEGEAPAAAAAEVPATEEPATDAW